jgi:membrane-associated phospholipid phosphatase
MKSPGNLSSVLPTADKSQANRIFLKWHLIAALFLFVLGLIALGADVSVARAIRSWDLPGDLEKSIELSEFFAHGFGVGFILVSILVLFPTARCRIPRLIACAVLSGLGATVLKNVLARIRPIEFATNLPESIGETWIGILPVFRMPEQFDYPIQSFPSAHTATAFGLAFGLIWLFPRGRYLFLSMACLGGLQRVVSQAHWSSDVLFGATVACLVSALVLYSPLSNRIFGQIEIGGARSSPPGKDTIDARPAA